MIHFAIDAEKRLSFVSGRAFAGDKGTTAIIDLPTLFGGLALADFDAGNIYIKYGDAYEAIELSALTGTVPFDIADAVFGEAGTITVWAEFSDTEGNLIQKTCLLQYIVEASETYSAPAASEDGAEGAGGTE